MVNEKGSWSTLKLWTFFPYLDLRHWLGVSFSDTDICRLHSLGGDSKAIKRNNVDRRQTTQSITVERAIIVISRFLQRPKRQIWESAYSQELDHNKINRQRSQNRFRINFSRSKWSDRHSGGYGGWWLELKRQGEEEESGLDLWKSSVFSFEWKICGENRELKPKWSL